MKDIVEILGQQVQSDSASQLQAMILMEERERVSP